MFQTTTQPFADSAFSVMQLEPVGPVSPDERRAYEHTQWIAARGSAARILGALADGVTPTAASLTTGVTMAPSLLANFCEFIALTHAGLDPAIGRGHVGQLRHEDAASAIELCAKERNRIRGLARVLRSGRKLDYLWFAKLAAYNPETTRNALQPVIATWTGISFERIHAARKLLPTLTSTTPLREAGHIAGYLLAGEVPHLATLEPLDIYLEDGGHVLPPKSEAKPPEHNDLEKFALTRLGGFAAERLAGDIPRDTAIVRAAADIAQFAELQLSLFSNMEPTQVFEMYERYVLECFRPHRWSIRALAAELKKRERLESAELFALGVRLHMLPNVSAVEGAPA